MPHPLILDTDPGVDDTMAIAFALAHPDIDLLALTTVFGNTTVEFATRNAQYVLDVLGARDVAVARGAAAPRVQPAHPPPDFVHGGDGLGNVYPASPEGAVPTAPDARHARVDERDAADLIVATARARPGELVLVAVGPLTNVAEALAREPRLPELVRELVVMGGSVDEPGNVSPLAEANFWNDPHAADEVFAADWPASVVGLDVTHRIMLDDAHLARLRDGAGATGDLIWRSSRFYVDFYSARANNGRRECAMHDAAALVHVVAPDAFERVAGGARVVTEGIAVGQLALDRTGHDYPEPHWAGRPPTRACVGVDAERVRAIFLDTIVAHHRR